MRVAPVPATLPGALLLYQDGEKVRQPVLFIWSVRSVWSVSFNWFVWFVLFVWLNQTNRINQMNQINKINQINQTNRACPSRPKSVFGLPTPNIW